ncbi:formate dehydrogenase accessory sulfurtransferase FdhD [Microvirga zambiensis]|uniref:formate dehydrogenase accessory sulfurtransferase FdhD n=1 Tax=Microvirga zambiensis TaxID=1402137 RepID=UPI001FE96B15|nr:formate dehydrogenase accessory sulfurtransferase FdhD [Microvirga zambiensis]
MTVVSFDKQPPVPATRAVPGEVPVNLIYGGIPFAVMMATPSDLEDFAVGFSLTEDIIQKVGEIRGIRIEIAEQGLRLAIDLVPERLREHLARRRVLSGRTGCGLCGIEDLAALPRARPPVGLAPEIPLASLRTSLPLLEGAQSLNALTRAVHGAAWAGLDGSIMTVREDVGRHNALDKLIGALCRNSTDPSSGFIVVTSRCSFELVEKVAAFGARTLVANSAPTSLALERARRLDIALVGIARDDGVTVFHGLERIRTQDVLA